MDRVVRLIALALVVFLASWPVHAYEKVGVKSGQRYQCRNVYGPQIHYAKAETWLLACSAVAGYNSRSVTSNGIRQEWSYGAVTCPLNGVCQVAYTLTCTNTSTGSSCGSSSGTANDALVLSGPFPETWCPDGSSMIGTGAQAICACNNGFRPGTGSDAGKCVQYTCPPSGSYSAQTEPDQLVNNAGDVLCRGGCQWNPSTWKVGSDGKIWATWPFKASGGFCPGVSNQDGSTTGEKNSNNPAPVACGANQCPGQVNGATICVPCQKQQVEGPSSSASAPGQPASAPAGTSSSTSCDGVNCTTTTVTKDGAGNTVGSVSETKPQESFCRENPESPLCKKSSFGGSCAATACDGDAVQCAIAAEIHKRNCEWFDNPTELKNIGTQAMNGQAKPDGHPGNAAESSSVSFSSTIDQTDRLGGGCPSDFSVTVMGKSLTIPFASICDELQLLGSLMVGVCMLAAAAIVFRG